MRLITFIAPLFLFAACSCATAPLRSEAAAVADELDSTVQIEVQVAGTLTVTDPDTGKALEVPVEAGWVGSGVVYEKSSGLLGPVTSHILTANHVLDAPKAGSKLDSPLGKVEINAVLMTVRTRSGRTCELKPLALGANTDEDVATGLAMCDAGRVAPIASSVPPIGAKVLVTGHPQGFPMAMATEGYVSGWINGFLAISAGAYGGNSGGPVWYNGEVVGLLVRGSQQYHHISLATPLKAVLERIEQTP